MEHSIQQSQGSIIIQYEPCSAKKCATCFENHGCMFEQYMAGSISTLDHQADPKADTVNPTMIESVWLLA